MSTGEIQDSPWPGDESIRKHIANKPLVSVLMITYNHEAYIEKAIQSVLAQETTFPFELVIGEDCSTDRTGAIVREYAEEFPDLIRLVTSAENVGGNKNARRVRDAARGEYFAFCEGDDYWKAPHKLQAQVDIILQDPDIGLVYCDHDRHITSTGSTTYGYLKSRSVPASATPDVEDILSGRAGILTCTVLARAHLIRQVVSSDQTLYGSGGPFPMEDTPLWAEVALLSKVRFIDESMSVRNILPESASRSRNEKKQAEFWILNAEMCLYLCDKHSLSEELATFHRKNLRRLKIKLAFLEGDAETTKKLLGDGERNLKDVLLHLGAEFKVVRWPMLIANRLRRSLQRHQ